MARSEMTVLIQKSHTLLKIPVANFCRLITPQTHPGLIMAGVWPP